MAKNSNKKQKKEKDEDSFTLNPIVLMQRLLQGRTFLSLGFFKRYWIYVVAGTVMMLMYIGVRRQRDSSRARHDEGDAQQCAHRLC